MSELTVTAKFSCAADAQEQVKEILAALAAGTKAEAGCVDYACYLEQGSSENYTTIETWASEEAEAAHWNEPHLVEALEKLGPLMLGEAEVTKYTSI